MSSGSSGSIAFLSRYLPSPPRTLSDDGSVAEPLDQLVVHQRLAHLERVRHAGAVDLGVDVADQVGLEVQVLDQRQRVVGAGARRVAVEHLDRVVAAELARKRGLNSCRRMSSRRIETRVEVGVDRVARERLEGGLRAQNIRGAQSTFG